MYFCTCTKCNVILFSVVFAYLLYEGQKRLSVVLPLLRKLALMGEFITAQEDGNLKTVCVQVAEIIHACEKNLY